MLKKIKIKTIISLFILFVLSLSSFFNIYSIEDIYVLSENNFVADSICKAIDTGIFLMIPLFAIAFVVIGYQAFNGKADIKIFFTFIVGIAIFKGSGTILNYFVPHASLSFGCKCATYKYIRDTSGVTKKVSTGLTEDCKTITEETTTTHTVTPANTGSTTTTP